MYFASLIDSHRLKQKEFLMLYFESQIDSSLKSLIKAYFGRNVSGILIFS